MKNIQTKVFLIILVIFALPTVNFAQSSSSDLSSYFVPSLIAVVAFILLGGIITVADNMLKIEAHNLGADVSKKNYGVFPKFSEFFQATVPAHAKGENVKILKKGHNIHLQGEAKKEISKELSAKTFAIQPGNFLGLSPIPKVEVTVGQEIKAGDILFYDKKLPQVKFTSPVSGEIIAINRGAKRSIKEIVILGDKEIKYRKVQAPNLDGDRQKIVDFLLDTGGWTQLVQRPYNIIPGIEDLPRDIFISTFDTAPLAPDLSFIVEGNGDAFQKGLDVLSKLTEGAVHLGISANKDQVPSEIFTKAIGVEKHYFSGAHPAGNVGIQIHHIRPIAPGHKVWTLNVQSVITIGKLWTEAIYDASRTVALTGAELKNNIYINTYQGAGVDQLVKDNLNAEVKTRLISGDVLSGKRIGADGYLDFHSDQLTVIEEGDKYELFGWLLPLAPRPTISKTYPNFLFPGYKFKGETNTHGEKRAFVVTGQYESVLPMDIHLGYLMKNIIINDFEMMEGLGIHELSEEDVALCEFVCTSKAPLQKILREGLEVMRDQG